MRKSKAADILQKYKDGTCTEEEKLLIKKWFLTFGEKRNAIFSESELDDAENAMWASIQDKLSLQQESRIRHINWKKFISAAAVLIFISIAALITIKYRNQNRTSELVSFKSHDLMPGSHRAVIIYNNGLQRTLNGKVYFAGSDKQNASLATGQQTAKFNTIITPRGGDYHIILADGTGVWLNAASSLKYPVSFTNQKERVVELTGEGYFQVAHNRTQPFKVKTDEQIVEVLGTHFNINAYHDEPYMATILMSGSIKISGLAGTQIMKPGEQARLTSANSIFSITPADTVAAMAWTNGFFQFRRANIQDVMRQLARWYDIDVDYVGNIPEKRFTGRVYRTLKLSQALEILTYFDVKFIVEGHKITIIN
jgi:hypothetical protein